MKAIALATLALTASANAELLVTPTFTSGSYQTVYAQGTIPPTAEDRHREDTSSTIFSSSFSLGSPNPSPQGNVIYTAAGFTNDFFFELPIGEVNHLRLRGQSASAAKIGPTNPIPFQTSGSAIGRAEFDVTTEVRFDLTGALTISDVATGGPGSALAMVGLRLTRNGITYGAPQGLSSLANASIPLNFAGTLLPGHYILHTFATTSAAGPEAGSNWAATAAYDARLAFSPIPAPATLPLLALGLAFHRRRPPQ